MILFHHRGFFERVAATESHRILALFRGTLFCMSYAAMETPGPPGDRALFYRLKAGGITLILATRRKNGASGRTRTDDLPVYETGPVAAEAQRHWKRGSLLPGSRRRLPVIDRPLCY